MALLYVAEYVNVVVPGPHTTDIQAPVEPSIDQAPVAIGGGSVQSALFGANTRVVRLHCDVICSVLFGTNPTVTTANKRLAANQTEYFGVPPGAGFRVAVISNV